MFEKPKMKGWYAMKRRNMNDGLRYWNGRQWSLIAWPTETALIALITACKEDATFCVEEDSFISFMNCLPCRLAGMNDLVHINDLTEKPKK